VKLQSSNFPAVIADQDQQDFSIVAGLVTSGFAAASPVDVR
jgi:hypothetical protein